MIPAIGDKYGQYQLVDLVGRGGMAQVYRAHRLNNSELVAVKILRPEMTNIDSVARFNREAKIMASLHHPNIIKLYEYGTHNELPYIVMQLLTGRSIAEEIQKGVIPLERVTFILTQVASALDYAHRTHIIHRDLKPQNILLDDAGNAVLSDFGMGKPLANAETFTRLGMVLGTPEYMSPEQIRAEKADGRTDVYSLGITLFEMLTGDIPFKSSSHVATMNMQATKMPPLVSSKRPELEMFDTIVGKALAKNPGERYATAGEFAEAFSSAFAQVPRSGARKVENARKAQTVPPVQSSAMSEGAPPASLAILIGAIIVVVGIAVLVVIVLSH